MSPKRIRSYLYLLLVAFIWGVAGPVIKYTLPDLPPLIFLTYRFFISSVFIIPFVIFNGFSLPSKKRDFYILTLAALCGSTINLSLLFYGYDMTSVLDASILSAIAPLFVVAASAIFLREKVTKTEKIGLIITLLGSIIITIQPLLENGQLSSGSSTGNIVIILANIAWVFYVIFTKVELSKKVDPLTITAYMFFLGFVTLLPLAVIQSGGFSELYTWIAQTPFKAHLGVWYMALLSGNLAYFLYQKGQKDIEASEATLFGYLSPVFSTPLAVLWLGENITITFVVGAIIISLGVFIAEIKGR